MQKVNGMCLPIDGIVGVKSCILWQKVWKKSCTFVICVNYTNNKRIMHVSELSSTIYCMSLYVLLLISITINEVFNNWIGPPSALITSRHLFSILLIKVCMRRWSQVGPGPLQNALEFLQRGIVLHPLVGISAWMLSQRFSMVLQYGGSCRPFHMLNAIFLQKLIGDSSTMRSCIVVHIQTNSSHDGCCIWHDVRLQHLVNIIVGRSIDLQEMALSVSGRIPLWRNSSAFCRGPGPTWINVAYNIFDQQYALKRCREVIEAMVDLSIIEHFIHCDAY